MHEAILAGAVFPSPSVVMGLALRPYSLAHEMFLLRQANPLALDPVAYMTQRELEVAARRELEAAALVCAQTFSELQGRELDFLWPVKAIIWKCRRRRLDLYAELAAFHRYRAQGSLEFRLSDAPRPGRETPARPAGAPFVLRVHQFLTLQLGLPAVAAWDYPWGLGKLQWAAYWEGEGGLDIYSAADESFDRFVEEQESAAAKPKTETGELCRA